MRRVEETLRELVRFDSVSSRSNLEIIDYLNRRCETLGLTTRRFSYVDAQGITKTNLIAASGQLLSHDFELVLVGHTDTVPYDATWLEALQLTEKDGKLFGRGACDTKGFIAAALTAVEQINLKLLQRPLALIFTADEEVGLLGAKHLADERAFKARHAIVGEPTSLRPMRAGKGYCLAEVTMKGREAHSAYPSLGSSAILAAARLLTALEEISEKIKDKQHAAFDPPFTTLNVGLIHGGSAKNVIPGECRFTLEWRPIPGQNAQYLLDLLNDAIALQTKGDANLVCEVDAARADAGFETSSSSKVVSLLTHLSGKEPGTVAFGTEAAQMAELGADAVVFGPGDIRVAHQTGEFVPAAELDACVEILKHAIEELLF